MTVTVVADGVLIKEVYPDTRLDNEPDEFVKIYSSFPLNISFWKISDGEGSLIFPTGTMLEDEIVVTLEAKSYEGTMLKKPDFEVKNTDDEIPEVVSHGNFRLANRGDEVLLFDDGGNLIDSVVYGKAKTEGWEGEPVEKPREGQILFRNDAVDTDTREDWLSPRKYLAGQSDFKSKNFSCYCNLTLFVSPDSSFRAVSDFISLADSSLHIYLYEFTNVELASALLNATLRGVDVSIILEGSPAGGIKRTEREVIGILEGKTDISLLLTPRYRFLHGKFAIADNESVLITTENWNYDGIPLKKGNRGWGVVVENRSIAEYYLDAFFDDLTLRLGDSKLQLDVEGKEIAAKPYSDGEIFPEKLLAEINVTAFTGPESSFDVILSLINSAEKFLYIEQFYIYPRWNGEENLFLEAAINAARRGVDVRILLDSYYYNVRPGDPRSNLRTVEYVNEVARKERLPLEARLIDLSATGLKKLHVKGVIADDKVLISSINWNMNSPTFNREIGIIIESKEVSEYFKRIFEWDWETRSVFPSHLLPLLILIPLSFYIYKKLRK